MLPENFSYNIILGSASPRRKELLAALGFSFTVSPSNANEDFDASLAPYTIAENLALTKAKAFTSLKENELYIACDTLVYCNGQVLNKPATAEEATAMLLKLSNKVHQVYTGVCLRTLQKTKVFHEVTNVHFRELKPEWIAYYIEKYKPFDKAGAYGIQEWIGYTGIEKIEGCYYNVMGLPLAKLWKELQVF